MYIESQMFLKRNPLLKQYLREHSSYYKQINRDKMFINNLYKEMQKTYKLTLPDKLDKVKQNLNMLNSFIEIIN